MRLSCHVDRGDRPDSRPRKRLTCERRDAGHAKYAAQCGTSKDRPRHQRDNRDQSKDQQGYDQAQSHTRLRMARHDNDI